MVHPEIKNQRKMSKNFNFTYGRLIQRGDRIISLIVRDAAQFEAYGYQISYSENLKSKLEIFRTTPTDVHWEGQQMLKTDIKKQLLKLLFDKIGDLRFRCKLTFGVNSIEYRSLRFNQLRNISDEELILFAPHLTKACRDMLEKLSEKQVTEALLTSIDETAHELDDAIDEQQAMIALREAKTLERQEMANEIYAMIAEICEVGKKIWEGKNPVYYHDYLIYGSVNPSDEESVEDETEDDSNAPTSPGPAAP